ncbi:MAG TPA: serine hydrolase domain-containing protein [Vicinamibacterales bacterium]|nr:serine hydrolase domain-containing protein [Vicinamibacterales bacterium]
MRILALLLGVLISLAAFEQSSSAQSFAYALFEGTLDSLRVEAGIPAISAAIVQDGTIAWTRGFGKQDLEGNIAARPDTPYPIGALAQTLGSTVLLRKCVDESYLEITDLVVRWMPAYPETDTSVGELLSHTAPDKTFRYAPSRLSVLTGVIEECAHRKYPQLLAQELFDLLGMIDSVPGQTLSSPSLEDVAMFDPARLARYSDILRRTAIPYRLINRRPFRNPELTPAHIGFAQGVVSSATDLAQFDLAYDGGFLASATRELALTQKFANGRPLRTGLGWFVQAYNDEPIAWQFGVIENAYSSLIVKVPNRRLTLILLANSDGLTAPFGLDAGEVTASIFARAFLRTFLP